ncbi:tripartite tricarboxylate transporter substrate binding protein [Microbacterium aerolatum]|uniref:Bug family tripartite tricarboxylate transporter substrate binding protein n=1 Tax=Microbacterium aerolatum TaxID=153731 RepID=UPI002001BA57|nr:tripartite tricarboxylate transporter substrate-binding protein [Microbacterium aerolatum]MCK3769020.1 tripartite tricarboxylate transporter substrate-binding protein [Microbacterium aerolatum]
MTQHIRIRTRLAAVAVLGVAAMSLAACTGSSPGGSANGDGGAAAIDSAAVIAPADPGGGWDQTARAFAQTLSDESLVSSAPVTNIGGAGGTVGLASLATETDPNTLMITGSVMVGAVETNASDVRIEEMTPIAKLTEEPLVVVVPKDSPYDTIEDFVDAWAEEGAAMAITGGSAGGIDHILAAQLLIGAGVEAADVPDTLNYIANSGGGEALTLLLGGQVQAGISGVGEFAQQVEAGELKALAVSSDEPAELLPDAPTLTDEGIDLVVTNWRGLIAPGGISDDEKTALEELVTAAHDSESWTSILETNGWTDAFLIGDEFTSFLEGDIATTQETLKTIGLIE